MNQISLKLETYKVKNYKDSFRHRHYYYVTSGIQESEIGELGLY